MGRYVKMLNIVKKYAISVFGSKFTKRNSNWYVRYINKTQFQIVAPGGKYILGRTFGWWAGLVPNKRTNNTIFTYDAKRYQIRSKENKCLDVLYGKTSKVGQPLVWYTCLAGANQKFKLYTVSKKVYT